MSVVLSGETEYLGQASFVGAGSDISVGADGRVAFAELLTAGRRMPRESMVLDAEAFSLIDEFGLRGLFVEDQELAKGREQSGHQLYFGQMVLDSVSDFQRPELVAMKPYQDDLSGAVHEWTMNTYVNYLGQQRAFLPLGLRRDADGDYHLITRYEHSVQSFDNILWADPQVSPEAMESERVKKAIRMSMFGIGLLHGLGIQHNDAQAKNIGVDSEKQRFIDLEEARIDNGSGNAEDEYGRDIDTFVESCFREADGYIGQDRQQDGDVSLEVAEAMLDILPDCARSYGRGICRSKQVDKSQLAEASVLSLDDVQQRVNRILSQAIERHA